ncbi:hypothetical protein SY83_02315 [Paenibacillus swuensis]|uniref:Uncharacterized protein n=1 Tax=Paenibacillus swuensis TaxID=1178515 RepID=A0A172TEM2_9BACL|nr:hypothetical protein [Paenibacillus swuensis]ANE45354.1 hypothetical protein SY83_02315 [Paenibacillus swuensis]
MNIHITVKSVGKRKPMLTHVEYKLNTNPRTLKDLISILVISNVQAYQERAKESLFIQFLTANEITDQAAEGKVGFGARYDERHADPERAVEAALLAFEDGLYRVFIEDVEVEKLADEIQLQAGDTVTFLKFTMLAGRLW